MEEVPASARAILALAMRLTADGVELVVMESTSDYWRIWYYLLEAAGLNVQLVNPAHARQLAGRPKTDRLDAQWIARLAEMGLLRPSFVPPPEIRALRDLTRTRLQLVPRPDPGVAAAGEAAGRRPGQAVAGRALAGEGGLGPGSWRRSPAASATRRPWPPWPRRTSRAGGPPSPRPSTAWPSAVTIPC